MDKLAAAVDKAMHDQAFMGLSDIANQTARIRDAVDVSLIVDADTGFGNALNTYQTVRTLERAGADCIQIEDQVSPKRCGHFSGKEVITTIEMIGKIKAAADARRDPDLLIMARTDACAVYGFEAALERAQLFSEAGADILFVEAVTTAEEMRAALTPQEPPTDEHGDWREDADFQRRRIGRPWLWHRAVCQRCLTRRSRQHAKITDCLARYTAYRRRLWLGCLFR